MKPGAVSRVIAGGAIDQQVDDAGGIDIPDLAAFVRDEQVTAGRQRPDTAEFEQTGLQGREAAAAVVVAAVAGKDGAAAVGGNEEDPVVSAVGTGEVAGGINDVVADVY